jgi:hypothetical protein
VGEKMKNGDMTSLIEMFNIQNIQYFAGVIQRYFEWIKTDMERYWNDFEDTNIKQNKSHFMNGVVTKHHSKNGLMEYISITDGQQRLTVTTLHITAICAYVKNNNISKEDFDYEKVVNNLLINPNETGDDKYKLLLREKDRSTLKMIIDELPLPLNEKAGNSPKIIKAYNFLYNKLNKSNYQETFDKLFLMTTLEFRVEPHEDENEIFDSLNNGGRKLSLFDQVRSFSLSKYPLKTQEKLQKKYWDMIEKNNSPNNVIRTFLISKIGYQMSGSAYDHFKDVALSYPSMDELFLELKRYYDSYLLFEHNSFDNKQISAVSEGINLIYNKNIYPFLIKTYQFCLEGKISERELIDTYSLILNVSMRYLIKTSSTHAINRKVFEISTMWVAPENLYNATYKKLAPFFISDSQFEMFICEKNFYRGDSADFETENTAIPGNINKITDYLLISIENYHYPKGRINPKVYSKEHICPQTLDNGWEHFFNQDTHHDNVHRLGNLTLTAYNPEYSNLSFEDKKTMENGFLQDKLYLNQCICKYHSWTVDSIQQRTELMAKELCEIFSIPTNNLSVTENVKQSLLVGGK